MFDLAWSVIPAGIENAAAFVLLGTLSAMVISATKAGFGGLGVLGLPIMVYACGGDTTLATGVMLPLLIATDLVALASWWRKWSWRAAWMLLPGAALGIVAGAAVLWALLSMGDSAEAAQAGRATARSALMLIVGVISLIFVALQAVKAVWLRPAAFRPVGWQGAAAGAAAGVTSTLAHAAGPVAAMFLLPQRMSKGAYVATTVVFFAIVNQLKLIPFIALGLINAETLGAGAVLLPGVVAGAVLGLLLHSRVPQRAFTAVVYALLAVAGGHMTYKALAALVG